MVLVLFQSFWLLALTFGLNEEYEGRMIANRDISILNGKLQDHQKLIDGQAAINASQDHFNTLTIETVHDTGLLSRTVATNLLSLNRKLGL